jgi:multicomponent K+:H+ antiporter subunit G
MSPVSEIVVASLLVFGAFFVLLGSLGLVKLPDFYARLHAPTKASTLGVGAILLASAIDVSVRSGTLSVHEVLITGFLFLTAPISAYMLAKSALHLKTDARIDLPPDDDAL